MANTFARTLRLLRLNKDLTTKDLAEMAKADRSVLSRIESGTREPTDEIVQKIAPVLGVTAAALILDMLVEEFGPDFEPDVRSWLDARAAHRLKRASKDFWLELSELELEIEVARLFIEGGYRLEPESEKKSVNPALLLTKGEQSVVVELMKVPRRLAEVHVRDLNLVRQILDAGEAFFVAPAGIEPEAISLAKSMPVTLLDAEGLAAMAKAQQN